MVFTSLVLWGAIGACCLTLPTFPQQSNQSDKSSRPATDHNTSAAKTPDGLQSKAVQGDGVYQVKGGVLPPKVIHSVDPKWTRTARRARLEGNCTLSLIVDAQGRPQNIQVDKPIGMGMDENAVAAVKKYRFEPATFNGNPVAVHLNIVVQFHFCEHRSDCHP